MSEHFTERLSKRMKAKCYKDLGIKLGLFATYGDLLDRLFTNGYWVELKPFHTFAFKDRMAVCLKVWKRDENDIWSCIYNEETDRGQYDALGGSFGHTVGYTLIDIIKKIKNEK